MKVPKIPKSQQLLSINHGLYKDLQNSKFCDDRMKEGAAKYGHSWCEVNLKQDILEEFADAHNYLILMRLRYDSLDMEPPMWVSKLIDTLEIGIDTMMDRIEEEMPEFEGPSSIEWVKRNVV